MSVSIMAPVVDPSLHQPVTSFCLIKLSILRLLAYLLVTIGFCYHVSSICQDYFSYPTTTFVSMTDAFTVTSPPKVALRIPFPTQVGMSLKDWFVMVNDSTKVHRTFVRTKADIEKRGKDLVTMRSL